MALKVQAGGKKPTGLPSTLWPPQAGVFHYDEQICRGETEKKQERNSSRAEGRNEGREQQTEVGGLLAT